MIIQKKILGILGGMGPQATIDFQQKILNLTNAGADQEHMRIFIDSHPQIPSRMPAILGNGESPIRALQESVQKLDSCGVDYIAMPCVTAHYFLPQLAIPARIKFLNMPELAAAACAARYPGQTAGVLSTEGTAKSGVVTDILKKSGIPFINPLDNDQRLLGQLISRVKAKADMEEIVSQFRLITERMSAQGAGYFLLACTEIPLIVQSHNFPFAYVDSTAELARAAVKACGFDFC